jgi:hypothetical protein
LNSEVGMRKSEKRKVGRLIEFGSGTRRRPKRVGLCRGKRAEVGKKESGKVKRIRKRESGLRPLRAVGSMLYEPEAIGAYAYAPVGSRK